MAHLLYGSGMRLMEVLRLRVKDVDFAQGRIVVREGKDRVTMLPGSLWTATSFLKNDAGVVDQHG